MGSRNIPNSVFLKNDDRLVNPIETNKTVRDTNFKNVLHWERISYWFVLHFLAFAGLYLVFTSAKIATTIYAFFLFELSAMGITAGVHRLWSHRSYKATWQLRLLLVILNSMTIQGHVLSWARDHRTHHKYVDTNADPYSASRGFFFSHIGWICVRKHPDVTKKGRQLDMSDLEADPILRFQKKYYWIVMPLFAVIIPSLIPYFCWNESLLDATLVSSFLRILLMMHGTFLVNSVAHFYGYKPYDRNMSPVENLAVSIIAQGEGFHNYHHAFPWDYKTSELGNYSLNFTTAFIDFFAWIGWAYDLKTTNPDIIRKRVKRTGDGSHELWGWGDKDITKEDREATIIN